MSHLPNNIVVMGNSISAWISSAALLASVGKYGVKVSHCVLDEPATALGNMSVRPEFMDFLRLIGMPEPEFMRSSQATFKLANYFRHWNSETDEFYHAFGEFGTGMANVQFSQAHARLQQIGVSQAVDTYSLGAQMAKSAKFCHPKPDPTSVLSSLSYGWNIDADAYRDSLKHFCISRGLEVIEDALEELELTTSELSIKNVALKSKQILTADLYIDCTEKGLLMQALEQKPHSWQQQIPSCNVATMELPFTGPDAPLTTISAKQDGWLIDITTQQKRCRQYYFAGATAIDPTITQDSKNIVIRQQHYGCMLEPWVANCIAIGNAALTLPGFCVSEVDVSWLGIRQLIDQCPRFPLAKQLIREYNRLVQQRYQRLKDVTCLHLHLADGHQGLLWQQVGQSELSADLVHKIKLYQSRGKLALFDEEVISVNEQMSLLMGLAHTPKQLDLMVQQVPIGQLQNIQQKIEQAIQHAAQTAPHHAAYLKAFCSQ
ncbi:tryptophan 7-halogenase [Paraglaciecola hydrolytica]|uniref:Tryptophan halogenase n=1 Tax=Paraglaciecola hydrolytica TaxID=1799789 RepID=A0A148KL84_9ALTE|nr:tryptophan 7-halogenase [Paraglaciecola hydrolytica]KXI27074.1 hypothetical protein AX660_01400 [Paraglaciecola hydrolytica]